MSEAADLNGFLRDVEKRAFRMAQMAVRDTEEALDIVQDSMLALARKYAHKPSAEWRPLFYGILKRRITDSHRRATARRKVFADPMARADEDGEVLDPVASHADRESAAPDVRTEIDGATRQLEGAVRDLPARQQQAFLLRAVEGMNVAHTARAMKCSEGSVKTHYSRAVHALREKLKEHWHG